MLRRVPTLLIRRRPPRAGGAEVGPAGADHARFQRFEEGFQIGDAGCDEGEGLDDLGQESGEVEGVREAAVGGVGGGFAAGGVEGVIEVVDLEDCCCDCAVETG